MIKKISVLIFAVLFMFILNNTITYAASTDIEGPSVIHKEANQVFTIGELLSLYDQDVFIDTDNFTGYGNIPGEYSVVLYQGNMTKEITIIVLESWSCELDNQTYQLADSNDVLYVTDYKDIYVSNDRQLTLFEMLFNIYGNTGYIETNYRFSYEQLYDTYFINFDRTGVIPEGVYELGFRLSYFSGDQGTYDVEIHTKEILVVGVMIEPPASGIENFVRTYGLWIVVIVVVVYLFKHRKKRGFNL